MEIKTKEGKAYNSPSKYPKKPEYLFLIIVVFTFALFGVYAYGTSNPSVFGHSAKEIDFSQGIIGKAWFKGSVEVLGDAKIGSSGDPCSSAKAGAMRFNSGSNKMEFCNGISWEEMGIMRASLLISANTTNYNIYSQLGSPAGPVEATLTINENVYVGSASISQPALTTGNLPSGSKVTIINKGHIVGKGGNGANGQTSNRIGQNGSDAIEIFAQTSIDNGNGKIWSGGGGGNGAGIQTSCSGGGGGGAGYSPGIHGSDWGWCLTGVSTDGTIEFGGSGAPSWEGSGRGGHGGNAGQNGYGNWDTGTGGYAGKSVRTNGNQLTWISQGDLRGPLS